MEVPYINEIREDAEPNGVVTVQQYPKTNNGSKKM